MSWAFCRTRWLIAVSLSYDDALDSQLDNAIPSLNHHNFRASFYIVPTSQSIRDRLSERREIALHGHELGNHTPYHPCSGSKPNCDWVKPDFYSGDYLTRARNFLNRTIRE